MFYPINEMFMSLQGEGYHTGKPAFFIRLAGCNLSCPWCDTQHHERGKMSEVEIVSQILCGMSPYQKSINIVITGGEPTIHDLAPLLFELRTKLNCHIAVETNGTHMKMLALYKEQGILDWVTFSPKPEHRYDQTTMQKYMCVVDEIKVVLDGMIMPNLYKPFIGHLIELERCYIQPCSEDFQSAVAFVMSNPEWRLSVQTQKILKIS